MVNDRRSDLTRRALMLGAAGAVGVAAIPTAAFARIIDLQELPDGETLEADLCIFGGGPAGIAIARRLAVTGARILLFEGGGRSFEPDTQDLYAGENVGLPYFDLDVTRLRFLGGCSNHWGNQVSDFEPIDLEHRSWIPHSGWPIKRSDLDSYYDLAFEYLDLGSFDIHDRGKWADVAPDFQIFDSKSASFTTKMFRRRLPALAVGEHYFDWLTSAPNLRLFLHANATQIVLGPDGNAVSHIEVATLTGKRFRARAHSYVIACGGMENPRLLLASNGVHPRGIGNGHDVVGRYFMDHLRIESGTLEAARGTSLTAYDEYQAAQFGRAASIYIRPEVQRREKLSVFRMKFITRGAGKSTLGYRGLKGLVSDPAHGRFGDVGTHLARLMLDPGGAWDGVSAKLRGTTELVCVNVIEQTPNPDSRVTLSASRDALGMNRIKLDWRLSEQERRTLPKALSILRKDFRAMGIGDLKLPPTSETTSWTGIERHAGAMPSTQFEGGHHHTGTTRMGTDPRTSVVDADCRVHGVSNLFMAGSSVFPTVGSANPTATICALAIRLADHLKERAA